VRYIISVDAGKHATKCVGRKESKQKDKQVFFNTRYYDMKNGDMEVYGKSYKITYQNNDYIIGEQGELYDTTTTKTSLIHKLATLTAIAKIANDDKNPTAVLTIGCPTAIYKNSKLKEEYRKFICEDNPISVTVDDVDYTINIEKVIVKCEGSGIVYLEPHTFIHQRVGILDLGGRNMNFGIYDNRVPVPSSLFSNNYGGILLDTIVREDLSSYYGEDYDLITANNAIKNGGIIINGKLQEESAQIVNNSIDNYIENYILKSIKEKNINLSTMTVVLVGGTSKFIIDRLKKYLPHAKLSNKDTQWANVEGFQVVGLVKAGVL
jgi:plasmid segregation protein ParM